MEETASDVEEAVAEIEDRRSHRSAVWTLIILGTVVMVLSTLNTWVERQLLDTDSWVDASTALIEDDDVRRELSVRLVNALYDNVDIGQAVDDQLPEELKGLGGPLAGVLRDPLIDTADTLLESDPVLATWKEANRFTHGTVVAILEDDVDETISTTGGKVVIDLGSILGDVGEQIGLPDAALDALPEDAGQFEVVDSEELETAQSAVQLIKILSVVTFLLVVILYGAAVYLARNWRREAVRNVGLATTLGGFIVLVVVRLGINVIASGPDTSGGRAATESVLTIGTELLRRSAWSEILIGLLIALVASLVGPARHAQWVRRYAAKGFRRQAVATWIGLAVLILVVLAWSPFSTAGDWGIALIVIALVVVGVEAIRRTSLAEEATRVDEAVQEEVRAESAETPVSADIDNNAP